MSQDELSRSRSERGLRRPNDHARQPSQVVRVRVDEPASPARVCRRCTGRPVRVRARFLENDVVLRYAYSNAQGGAIGTFDVAIDDCL